MLCMLNSFTTSYFRLSVSFDLHCLALWGGGGEGGSGIPVLATEAEYSPNTQERKLLIGGVKDMRGTLFGVLILSGSYNLGSIVPSPKREP